MKNLWMFFITGLLCISTANCNKSQKIDEITDELSQLREQSIIALNDAINQIEQTDANWQQLLEDLDKNMDERIQQTLTYNVPFVIGRASGKSLSTILCVKEATKDDILFLLKHMLHELLTGKKSAPTALPRICITEPTILDLNAPIATRRVIYFSGTNFHSIESFRAFLINEQTKDTLEIPANKINWPDFSTITVTLDEYGDTQLAQFTSVELRFMSKVISDIGIIKQSTGNEVVKTVYTNETQIVFTPPHTYGDQEFEGNGPAVNVNVYLMRDSVQIWAQVDMSAIETGGDYTAAVGVSPWKLIYTVPSGYLIKEFNEPYRYDGILKNGGVDYVDSSTLDYITETVVGRAIVVGDTNGLDAGVSTKISLDLRKFKLQIVEK